jgi:MFS family permease
MRPPAHAPADDGTLDPRRWITLAIVIIAAFIVVLDNSVLNVAIPTILREFDTTLPSLQWVITGYALTFATFLIIGGRLGDVYGHRRIFIIGAALFGAGSLLAAVSSSVPQLVLGEAVIEGLGASLMLPATLAILSGTFQGRERATAFAMWGAVAGAGAAFGPVLGGFLTTNYSWRWAFIINVIVAPIAIVGALLFMRPARPSDRPLAIDVPGAALIAVGMFLLVFGLSEGGRYGWITPLEDFSIGGVTLWPATAPIALTPIVMTLSVAVLYSFYRLERAKERRDDNPLFEFSGLRLKTYRYGLLTGLLLAMGQLGVLFVLPVFLQDGKHLTAEENGLWLLPTGLFVILGAQVGGRLTRRYGPTVVVRIGLAIDAVGILLIAMAISPDITVLSLMPGFALYGMGIGFAGPQLTNVILSEIPERSSGVASGANTTVRQVGTALGVAVIGALLTAQTVSHAISSITESALPAGLKAEAKAAVHALGSNFAVPSGASAHDANVLRQALESGVATGTRYALAFAAIVVGLGAVFSFLIPRDVVVPGDDGMRAVNAFEPLEPMDAPRRLVEPDRGV